MHNLGFWGIIRLKVAHNLVGKKCLILEALIQGLGAGISTFHITFHQMKELSTAKLFRIYILGKTIKKMGRRFTG